MAEERPTKRLLSLDAFRGITIAAMIIVNDPGSWDAIYAPLKHAEWHGWTPTDLIFPFFLFIVGVSISLSLRNRLASGDVGRSVYFRIIRRAVLLFAIGVFLNALPLYDLTKHQWIDLSTLRIMGVLQRIAICYLIASFIFIFTDWRKQVIISIGLLIIYWELMTWVEIPECLRTSVDLKPCNLAAYIDRLILGTNHMWQESKVFDPEGLLSTIPAIVSTLAGVLTGSWLSEPPASEGGQLGDASGRSEKWPAGNAADSDKVIGLLIVGILLSILGLVWNNWLPINKNLWTGSYVVFTTGAALLFLGVCYWLIDIRGYREWAKPFIIFGVNAIALYIGSSIMDAYLGAVIVSGDKQDPVSLQSWIFENWFLPWAEPINASLAYAIAFTLVWLILMWLLYRKQIFIRL
jgi:predicted acyltransferase